MLPSNSRQQLQTATKVLSSHSHIHAQHSVWTWAQYGVSTPSQVSEAVNLQLFLFCSIVIARKTDLNLSTSELPWDSAGFKQALLRVRGFRSVSFTLLPPHMTPKSNCSSDAPFALRIIASPGSYETSIGLSSQVRS
jgi:hypothetical protein